MQAQSPEIGEKAAEESQEELAQASQGCRYGIRYLQVWAAVPVQVQLRLLQRIAKDMGILTVGVVTKPFRFEAKSPYAATRSMVSKD